MYCALRFAVIRFSTDSLPQNNLLVLTTVARLEIRARTPYKKLVTKKTKGEIAMNTFANIPNAIPIAEMLGAVPEQIYTLPADVA